MGPKEWGAKTGQECYTCGETAQEPNKDRGKSRPNSIIFGKKCFRENHKKGTPAQILVNNILGKASVLGTKNKSK